MVLMSTDIWSTEALTLSKSTGAANPAGGVFGTARARVRVSGLVWAPWPSGVRAAARPTARSRGATSGCSTVFGDTELILRLERKRTRPKASKARPEIPALQTAERERARRPVSQSRNEVATVPICCIKRMLLSPSRLTASRPAALKTENSPAARSARGTPVSSQVLAASSRAARAWGSGTREKSTWVPSGRETAPP